MKNQKPVSSNRKQRDAFVEPAMTIACTRKVRKIILANLRKAAYSRLDPVRAGRSRQLLEQVETRPAAVVVANASNR